MRRLLLFLLLPATAAAQPRPQAEEEAMRLVVMIRATMDGTERVGAGIVVGAEHDRLYVVTANHVVREGALTATDVTVQLRTLPGERLPARLLADHDAGMDVAVLAVPGLAALGVDPATLPFDRLGDPAALRRGDPVRALGYPQGSPWSVNVRPDPIAAAGDSVLTFESAFVGVGHSGGALLDDQWRLVGLLQTVQPPEATARRLDVVLDRLRAWRYPVALRRRFDAAALEPVSAGAGFTCAIGAGGAASCWGGNEKGELGTGTGEGSTSPMPVRGRLAFATISAGLWFACGVTLDGAAWCWGDNESGELGTAATPGSRVPVPVEGGLRFAALSAGRDHACGVTTAGELHCWGSNAYGQLGDGTKESRRTPVRVRSAHTFRAVSAGNALTCALATDGRAHCWGVVPSGSLGDGASRASPVPVPVAGDLAFRSVSAGNGYACGVATDGAGHCWGDNEWGQLGDGTTTASVRPRRIAGELRLRAIAVSRLGGRNATCALDTDGAAWCWGWESEALGRHDLRDTARPGRVATEARFVAIAVDSHVCGRTADGELWCWGSNRYGQLGDGSTADARITPRLVPQAP